MLSATTVAFLGAPFIAIGLAVADVLAGRPRLPRVRLFGLALQYLFNDSVEIVAAPWLWLIAGFGTHIDSKASIRRHARIQRWSIDILARRAERLLGLRIEVEGADQLVGAPVIVLNRHVSLLDASLPALLYGDRYLGDRSTSERYDVRGVIMAEMLADPGFDLIYGRLGSVFINRDRGTDAQAAIQSLGEGLDGASVAGICPEGRLFDSGALERAKVRLGESDPERAERLADLRHVLPPRPGGVISLLRGAPRADVVVVAHAGFEQIPSLSELARTAPVDQAIRVRVRRIPRCEVPGDDAGRMAWLDSEWLSLDAWVDATVQETGVHTDLLTTGTVDHPG